MADVFISHVEADSVAAGQLTEALVAAGLGVEADLHHARAVVVLVSEPALGSARVSREIEAAHARGTPFVPVLVGLTHLDLATRTPEWRAALGTATSIEVPPEGVPAIAARVVDGVRSLLAPPARSPGRAGRRGLVAAVLAVVVVLAGAGVAWALTRGGGEDDPGSSLTPAPGLSAPGSKIPRSTGSVTPGPVADSATTALTTVAGDLRINRTRFTSEFCPTNGDCARTTGTDRLVVLRVTEWSGRDLPYTEDFARQMDSAYVRAGDARATFVNAQQDPGHGSWDIVYTALPVSALSGQVEIVWPGSPTLVLHPVER